ncbi:MAG: hypothetical protein C5B53_10600 [Candidatus Melainabacteria bacterium]|nr:MAG: hypothetical protein C5B53_10600 [Candidatus Melainabacteria bacterium]
MRVRHTLVAAAVAMASLVGFQSISFAGAASRQGFISGHVRSFGSHHLRIQQPPPVQAAPMVNVRDFGATGNGVTDDTAAIQNAINAAHASGEGVFFPAGTYLHTNVITANGVSLVGAGGGSTLLANNQNASAVILTGVSPSIQNLVINSVPAGANALFFTDPNKASLAVVGGQNFVVQGITIVQGMGRPGVFLQQSAIGQVSSVSFDGSSQNLDVGVIVDGCSNVSIVGNLFQGESTGVQAGGISNFIPQSIAIIGNSVVSSGVGISVTGINIVDVDQNQIQITLNGNPLSMAGCNNYSITRNVTSGGNTGITVTGGGGFSGVISQNVIRNCVQTGAVIITNIGGGGVQFVGNQFGECGTQSLAAVIDMTPLGGPDSVVLLNNVYQGHQNQLLFFIRSLLHVNVVSGNAQTQTALPNSLP